MLNYLTLAAKVKLNVHDLNNEAVAGNVTDIRVISFLNEENEIMEAPAVSGRMLKHWHYDCMRKLVTGIDDGLNLCAACEIGEPMRPGTLVKDGDVEKIAQQTSADEKEVIETCMLCDVHGYLIAQEGKKDSSNEEETSSSKRSKKPKGTSTRRNSRVLFSWLLPVLDSDSTRNQVIHTRVTSGASQDTASATSQMIFSKSYASGVYGFVSALDAKRIGVSELYLKPNNEGLLIDEQTKKKRIIIAIEAYRLMLTGQMGASLSHALPHAEPIELLVSYSNEKPIPFPVSPIYKGYLEKTIGLLPKHAKILYWSETGMKAAGFSDNRLTIARTLDELFETLRKEIEAQA